VAVREERVGRVVESGALVPARVSGGAHRGRWAAAALALAAGALLAVRCDLPGFFDNEGRYAEVAREMVASGDYVTPRIDGTLFLNKPPLTYWLAALVFRLAGPTEWARLVAVAAAVLTLFAACRIGARLYGEAAGLIGGVVLATSLGFVLEARTLRPDMVMTACIALALLCWLGAERGERRWLAGFYVALGLGVLIKGLVPLVVAGIPIGAMTLRTHGPRGLRRLRPLFGLGVVAAIVLPWHALVASKHPGFAWDYLVNQHLLFFFDRKLPRDSSGDGLGFFWAAFAGRALPWTFFLPLGLAEAVRGAARTAGPAERGTFFLWLWAGGLLLFFSCAPSRLEHYGIPALPAAALLAARVWQRGRAGELGRGAWIWLTAAAAAAAAVGVGGLAGGRALLERVYWIAEAPVTMALAVPAATTLAAAGVVAAVAAARRRAGLLVATLALAAVPLAVIVLRAEIAVEPLFSWRPLAQALVRAVPPGTEIVFEAPEEYQQVGGLAFYTGRRLTLLAPPGFVPPTYLAGEAARMFLAREEFTRRWRAGIPLALVSDPKRRRNDPRGLVPEPFHVLARFGDRWVLTNFAAL
jgi:4-amino-4-deoxy-L-arabinose transferase-like glycosyltransferase